MKKLNHKERLDQSIENVKSIKTKKNGLSPKGKKIARISTISLGTAGIIAGATVGIYNAATADKESVFPFSTKDQDATKFKSAAYDTTNEQPTTITHKDAGASVISVAQKGGVKFISDYGEMFNDEKLSDLADWFYKDVNWGPEIATLHGINLMSGVQSTGGRVTHGYHTTSRDGSIIVMSPDVIFDKTASRERIQNLTYWYQEMTKNTKLQPAAGTKYYSTDGQSYRFLDDDIKNPNNNYDPSDTNYEWFSVFRDVINDIYNNSIDFFESDGTKQTSYKTKLKEVLANWDDSDDDKNTAAILRLLPSKVKLMEIKDLLKKVEDETDEEQKVQNMLDMWKNYWGTTDAKMSKANNDLLEEFAAETGVDSYTIMFSFALTSDWKAAAEQIGWGNRLDEYKNIFKKTFINYKKSAEAASNLDGITGLVKRNVNVIKTLISNPEFNSQVALRNFQFSEKETPEILNITNTDNNPMDPEMLSEVLKYSKKTRVDSTSLDSQHFISQLSTLALGSPEQVETTMDGILMLLGAKSEETSRDEILLSLMKSAALLVRWQGDRFATTNLYGFEDSKISLGSNAIGNLYNYLKNMSKDELLGISSKEFISKIYESSTKDIQWTNKGTTTTSEEVQAGIDKVYASSNSIGTALSKHLQSKYNPGVKTGNGHGIPAWKEGDSPYDSAVRRMMIDMEYTISHEYGHHITMTYAQDISDSKHTVINSEALANPSQASLGSAAKRETFKKAFDSEWFKNSLHAASDGDTKTDLGYQRFDAKVAVGGLGEQDLEFTASGIRGEGTTPNQMTALIPTVTDLSINGKASLSQTKSDDILWKLVQPVGSTPLVPDKTNTDWLPASLKQTAIDNHLNTYLVNVYTKALGIVNAGHSNNVAPNATALYEAANEIIGEYTRKTFEEFTGTSNKYITNKDGKALQEIYPDVSSTGLTKQIISFDLINKALREIDVTKTTADDVKTEAATQLVDKFDALAKETFADEQLSLSTAGAKAIIDQIYDGEYMVFDLIDTDSPASVAYVFKDPPNNPAEEKRYKRVFSTIVKGSEAPGSFSRYQMSFDEIMTRLLQQMSFKVQAELLTTPGEYYSGDLMRFAMYGEDFYDVVEGLGPNKLDGTLTQQGKDAIAMWKKFFGMDKEITAMVHSKDTGLTSMYGFMDKTKQVQFDHLVFEDLDGKVVTAAEMIYGVDNYHVYDTHGDVKGTPASDVFKRESFDPDVISWTIDGMVVGNFANSLLKQGEYKLTFAKDSDGDGTISQTEADAGEAITNEHVTHEGVLNNNGRSDETAEIEGNPGDTADTDQFMIKINDVRV